MKLLFDLSLNCREASRLQSLAMDHKLSFRQRTGLRIHLLLCNWCRRYGKQLRFLGRIAREHPEELTESASQKLSDVARERIKQSLRTRND